MATELGKAYVQIVPSARGIGGAISGAINPEAQSAGVGAGKLLGSSLVSMLTGAIAAAGIGKLITSSLMEGANLEQNLGGTQAVFGQFADAIQSQAKTAYSNMGLSASDYMATANKMGSLFQGSGIEQQKALSMTSDAMQRAADVASVMGVDMQMAMESVAGAAKGNFTMMDNLGVAMNATTLEAYALEKGMNFEWKTASNAQKAELAMQMFMDRTSQYAGNFARESRETFSGSLDAMKASWKNVLGNLSTGEDIMGPLKGLAETSSAFMFNNLIPMLGNIFKGLPSAIGTFMADAGPQIAGQIQSLFSNLGINIDFSAISVKYSGVVTAFQPVVDGFKTAFDQLPGLFQSLYTASMPAIDTLVSGFAKLDFSGVKSLISAIIPAVQAGFQKMMSIVGPSLDSAMSSFVGLWNAAQPLLSLLSKALMPAFDVLGSFLGGVFSGILSGLKGAFDLLKVGIEFFMPAIQWLVDGFISLQPHFSSIAEKVGFVTGLFSNMSVVGQGLGSMLQSAWNNIHGAISAAGNIIGGAISFITNAFTSAGSASGLLQNIVSSAFSFIGNIISGASSIVQGAINAVKSVFTDFGGTVSSVAQTVIGWIDNIKNIFDSLKNIDLSAAGKAILDGFLGGLKSGWDSVTGFVGGIADWIAENKGPIEYDRVLLKPHGSAIMEGLNNSLVNSFKTVKTTVSGMASELVGAFGDDTLAMDVAGNVEILMRQNSLSHQLATSVQHGTDTQLVDAIIQLAKRPIVVSQQIDKHEFARLIAQPLADEQKQLSVLEGLRNGVLLA